MSNTRSKSPSWTRTHYIWPPTVYYTNWIRTTEYSTGELDHHGMAGHSPGLRPGPYKARVREEFSRVNCISLRTSPLPLASSSSLSPLTLLPSAPPPRPHLTSHDCCVASFTSEAALSDIFWTTWYVLRNRYLKTLRCSCVFCVSWFCPRPLRGVCGVADLDCWILPECVLGGSRFIFLKLSWVVFGRVISLRCLVRLFLLVECFYSLLRSFWARYRVNNVFFAEKRSLNGTVELFQSESLHILYTSVGVGNGQWMARRFQTSWC